jgi:hypothetical protein
VDFARAGSTTNPDRYRVRMAKKSKKSKKDSKSKKGKKK